MDLPLLLKTIRDGLAFLIYGAGVIAAVQLAEAYMAGPV